MSVDCRKPRGWTLAQRVSASDPSGVETLTLTMTNAACAKTPAFVVRVKQRQGDSQVRWHTGAWYPNLRPDWRDKAQSSFLSGLPVHALATMLRGQTIVVE